MFRFLDTYKKHRAIRKYIKKLGPQLKRRYGSNKYFTEGQIRTTLELNKLGGKYAVYAYGLYLAPEQLDGVLMELEEPQTSKAIRNHLATMYLGGATDYSFEDIVSASDYCSGGSSDSWSDSDSDSGDCGGGDGGD